MTTDEPKPVDSPIGKQILAYAAREGNVVLEFKNKDDGSLMVLDVTRHVRALEEQVIE